MANVSNQLLGKKMKNRVMSMLLAATALFLTTQASANPCPPGNPPTNCAPPAGAIFDLNGTAVSHSYKQYFTAFTAGASTTNISFALREDPAYFFLDDVSVKRAGGGPELLLNPGFEDSTGSPLHWTFLNAFGAAASGTVVNNGAKSGSNSYKDGSVQAYDGITQAISTTIGETYNISFWLNDNGPLSTYSRLSTNGNISGSNGNGIDLLVYAGVVPTLIPEPISLALVGIGLVGIAFTRRRSAGQ